MGDADGGVGRVDALPAGAGRAVDVDLQLVRVDLDLDLLGLGHDGHGRGGRVDAPLRLGLGDALHPMRPALPLEDRVRAVALDGEGDLLEAAAFALADRKHLGLEAAPLCVPGQHAVEVAGPERSLVAPYSLPDLDEDVLVIGRVGLDERELEVLLERSEALLELRHELAQVAVALRRVEVLAHAAPGLSELVRAFELLQAPSDIGRLPVVVVDGRVRQALLRFPVGALDLVDELLDGHAAKGSAAQSRHLTMHSVFAINSKYAICPNE